MRGCNYDGDYPDAVRTSLMVLKAQTYAPTGGIVAAPTTSLPEWIGGPRNWDYRYCWVRDATFTLYAMMNAGYIDEARAWRDWLLRAAAGDPAKLQILYGVAGERRINEYELDWLPGYAGSKPVRVGNAAHEQFQLDVYGELIDALHQSRRQGLRADGEWWSLGQRVMEFLEGAWDKPDEGIWEVRGPRRHFVHSKVLAWVGVRPCDRCGRELRPPRPGRALAPDPPRDSRGGLPRGLPHGVELVHAELRLDRARRGDADDPAGRIPAARPTRASSAPSTGSSAI